MTKTLLHPKVRESSKEDLAAVDALMARAFPALLKTDYAPSVLVTALPLISRANPALLSSGSYFVAELEGDIIAAGGWTFSAPGGKPGARGVGHVRHVVTSPDHVRQGVGRALMANVLLHAKGSGVAQLQCWSTLTAVPFYTHLGFENLGGVAMPLRPGIALPCVAMRRTL